MDFKYSFNWEIPIADILPNPTLILERGKIADMICLLTSVMRLFSDVGDRRSQERLEKVRNLSLMSVKIFSL